MSIRSSTHQDGLYDVLGAALEELFIRLVERDDEGDADGDRAEQTGERSLPDGRLELLPVDLVEELQQDGDDHHRLTNAEERNQAAATRFRPYIKKKTESDLRDNHGREMRSKHPHT